MSSKNTHFMESKRLSSVCKNLWLDIYDCSLIHSTTSDPTSAISIATSSSFPNQSVSPINFCEHPLPFNVLLNPLYLFLHYFLSKQAYYEAPHLGILSVTYYFHPQRRPQELNVKSVLRVHLHVSHLLPQCINMLTSPRCRIKRRWWEIN